MSDPLLNENGMTELHIAAWEGDLTWVQNCLRGGLDVHARDKDGHTPLWWAADMGIAPGEREAVIDTLIAAGSDVNAKDNYGESVLESAIRAGNDDIVQKLRNAGAT
ncbi:ankyrin repeat domain-containing protein [Verrucomicrobiota bacterium sgz303538]